jgi:hypothetical protein
MLTINNNRGTQNAINIVRNTNSNIKIVSLRDRIDGHSRASHTIAAIGYAASLTNPPVSILNFGHGWPNSFHICTHYFPDPSPKALRLAIEQFNGIMNVTSGWGDNHDDDRRGGRITPGFPSSWAHLPTSFGLGNVVSVGRAYAGRLHHNSNWGGETVHLLVNLLPGTYPGYADGAGSFTPSIISRFAAMLMNKHSSLTAMEARAIILSTVDVRPELLWDNTPWSLDGVPQGPRGRICTTGGILSETNVMQFVNAGQLRRIFFHGNGGNGEISPQPVLLNSTTTLMANTFTRPGFTFLGWATSAANANAEIVSHIDRATLQVGTSNIILHAVWAAHAIIFHKNDGSGETRVQAVQPNTTVTLHPNTFTNHLTNPDFGFFAWATMPGTNPSPPFFEDQAIYHMGWHSNVNLYAQWRIPVTITFHSNDGTNRTRVQNAWRLVPTTLMLNTWTRPNHTFAGWSHFANMQNGIVSHANGANYTVMSGFNDNLYAMWAVTSPTITLDRNGGVGGPPQTTVRVTYGSPMPSIGTRAPTKIGYTFDGYFDAINGGTRYYNDDLTSARNWDKLSGATLWARWILNLGTATNPFLIRTEAELRKIGTETAQGGWTLSAHYKLMTDIILTIPPVGQSNWIPIGSEISWNTQFTGTFDGNNKTISNLTINTTANNQGMFGSVGWSSIIRNLGLENVNISGGSQVGGMVGVNRGRVQNSYVTGNILGTDIRTGGLVGDNWNGSVQNSYVIGNVSGNSLVGGVAGSNSGDGLVQNSYAIGNVSGNNSIGGVVGLNISESIVLNSYAIGTVSGNNSIGGVVGSNSYDGAVQNSYAIGTVSGNNDVGGVVGLNSIRGSVQNCVALNLSINRISGTATTFGRVVGRNSIGSLSNNYACTDVQINKTITAGLTTIDGANLLECNEIFWISLGFTDPWWWSVPGRLPIGKAKSLGTATNPFLIKTEADLRRVGRGTANPDPYKGWTLSAHYKLMTDIILTIPAAGQSNWLPIGTDWNIQFSGTFDGNNKTISNLTINTTANNQGMFGFLGTAGMVKNLGLENVNINGNGKVGGMVGENRGTVQNCYVTGNVSGTAQQIGGMVGENWNGTIQNCYATATVIGNNSVGGVVGSTHSGSMVRNSYSIGNVYGNNGVGGVAGASGSGGTVQNSYATGSVYGNSDVGGVKGLIGIGTTVLNCIALNLSINRISGTATTFGRVAGRNSIGSLSNNYARNDMQINKTITTGLNTIDGADLLEWNETFWTNLGFTDPWWWSVPGRLPIGRVLDCMIGETGPAGGIIFYDKGYFSDGWQYLEVAPIETEFIGFIGCGIEWYLEGIISTEEGVGTGKQNTEYIVEFLDGMGITGSVAQLCVELDFGGFNDWFLPSIGELELMYQNLHISDLGDFFVHWFYGFGTYWSSTISNSNHGAWTLHFYFEWLYELGGSSWAQARAIRQF